MDLFMSWSGNRSRLLADALSEFLPDVVQDVKTWMSADDISAGSRWATELERQLEKGNFGILCITAENIGAPWILFEAGCLAKSLSTSRVVPVRLGMAAADVPYPLAQFQGVDANEAGLRKLVQSLNGASNAQMDQLRLDRVFGRTWPDLKARLEKIPKSEDSVAPRRPERELLEEILNIVRGRPDGDPEQFSAKAAPKTAVWLTLHDVTVSRMQRMTDDELRQYIIKVRQRIMIVPHGSEEYHLDRQLDHATAELERRSGEGSLDPQLKT
jgi:TIR domain